MSSDRKDVPSKPPPSEPRQADVLPFPSKRDLLNAEIVAYAKKLSW
jgi:hypothetical protein